MTETPLDIAHAAMESKPHDDALRLKFFERLGDAELFLLLETEAEGEVATPQTFDTGSETLVLAFDRAERLASFVGNEAPYVGLSGRSLVEMLADEGLGLALNPEVAQSSFVLAAEGVSWLAEMLQRKPEFVETAFEAIEKLGQLPDVLIHSLDQKLATAIGMARAAYLVGTRSEGGKMGHMLAIVAPLPGAEPALVQAIGEALSFSGLDTGFLDVTFFDAGDPLVASLSGMGLRFDIPQADLAPATGPGLDPKKPPVLK